ncbi:hypothetical protein HanRHA438_Chr08g0332821 [Helianthus annuus]|nr:hypothetical protein HanRHA438_Chr08g0332821 [Helianthus annuus]
MRESDGKSRTGFTGLQIMVLCGAYTRSDLFIGNCYSVAPRQVTQLLILPVVVNQEPVSLVCKSPGLLILAVAVL